MGTGEPSRVLQAGSQTCGHLEGHDEVCEMELSLQVQLDGDHGEGGLVPYTLLGHSTAGHIHTHTGESELS